MSDKIKRFSASEVDDQLNELMNQLSEIEDAQQAAFMQAYVALANTADAGSITLTINNCSYNMPLINVEIIALFSDFLLNAIDYFKEDC
jgi:hypothetical protein